MWRPIDSIRARFYAKQKGISVDDATLALWVIKELQSFHGWDKRACCEHVEYFIVRSKIKGRDITDGLSLALMFPAPMHVSFLNETESGR